MRQRLISVLLYLLISTCLLCLFTQVTQAQIEIPKSDLNSMCGSSDYYNTAMYGCTPCGEGAIKN